MEKQLFSWIEWDHLDTACFYFYDVTLKQNIGEHNVDEKFDGAMVDYENGTLTLQRGEEESKFSLKLLVV